MSRIGRLPVPLTDKVKVQINGKSIDISGPNGSLHLDLPESISAVQEGNTLVVSRAAEDRQVRSLHGLCRAQLNNMVVGVTEGYRKSLDIVGTGYRATMEGAFINIQAGLSHPVLFPVPVGIKVELETNQDKTTRIKLFSADKQLIGETAARIRRIRPPEPYLGKGIRFTDEKLRRKVGKTTA